MLIPLLVLVLVTGLAMAAVQVQAAVRAFERSANQTANVHLQAVNALLRYAHDQRESDWQHYREVMRIPESAQQTRRLLLQHGPEALPEVEKRMIAAGREPGDVAAMLRLYRWVGPRFMSDTTRMGWRQTDALMDRLEQEAQHLHAAAQAGTDPIATDTPAVLQRIHAIDTSLRATDLSLSASWARAARSTTLVLQVGIGLIAAVLALLSALLIRRSLAEQTHYTRALSEAHRRWELASHAAGLGLYQLDAATGDIQLDGTAAAMHGLGDQPCALKRDALRALIVEEDVLRTRQEVDEALQVGDDYRITYRVRQPDGQVRTLEASGRRIQAGRPQHISLIGVLRDVTEAANQAEQALRREAAERVAQEQRAFLSRLSHELRTPLNAILGFAQLLGLGDRASLGDAQRQQVQWILTAGQQLLALIEDVLDLSKVEAGEITLHLERVDVNALVRECLPLLDAARQQHQITLLNRAAETPLYAQVDAQRLRQIVINLLSNACKYNRPHGHATIDTRLDDGEVVIDISDDGIGMRPEDAAQLFQPFKRVASAMGHAEGTGLGLYIVKQLVERMQGQVSVVSELGVGTRFSVRLPQA
jgi:PAS domain S-box-containing protein